MSLLPDPEVYIIINGRPTKNNIIWQSLVNVDNVKQAVLKLKETNILLVIALLMMPQRKQLKQLVMLTQPYWKRVPKKTLMVCRHIPFEEWMKYCLLV